MQAPRHIDPSRSQINPRMHTDSIVSLISKLRMAVA